MNYIRISKKKFEKINKLLRKDRQKRRMTLLLIMALSILAGVLSVYTFVNGIYSLVTSRIGVVDFAKNLVTSIGYITLSRLLDVHNILKKKVSKK